ncbi:MAG: fumarylacetoacetate hydrolase family protein [Methylocystis sp.]|nr:fumarylacetoacetate hydrolase family protein [Methylocystis sp.]MCA3587818.1 fumarylacetoacetate hydrolase family protein [Methylocystis sp.]MCA3592852.1 fumarylacetoacetate hydrolase family protein [Methylocystis sp.]
MRLATIRHNGIYATAVILPDGSALLLADAARAAGLPNAAYGSMQSLIEAGDAGLNAVRALVANAGALDNARVEGGKVVLAAPLPRPAKNVFCVGRNYAEHIAEGERAQNIKVGITEHPVFFTKPATSVVGPGGSVLLFSHISQQIDYEVELAVIIGKAGRDIRPESAFDHVYGYTILNDVTARDVQRRHGGQYFKGKGLDTSCPMGPWIVTADALPSPGDLGIRIRVNGELRQNGNTSAMIFNIPTLIASLSEGLTLEPGDIIATGTPAGVGYAMNPPRFLQHGDVVECEIDGIGKLSNSFATAPAPGGSV